MTLTDTLVKKVARSRIAARNMPMEKAHIFSLRYGKYWRLDYWYLGKYKTLALGV